MRRHAARALGNAMQRTTEFYARCLKFKDELLQIFVFGLLEASSSHSCRPSSRFHDSDTGVDVGCRRRRCGSNPAFPVRFSSGNGSLRLLTMRFISSTDIRSSSSSPAAPKPSGEGGLGTPPISFAIFASASSESPYFPAIPYICPCGRRIPS